MAIAACSVSRATCTDLSPELAIVDLGDAVERLGRARGSYTDPEQVGLADRRLAEVQAILDSLKAGRPVRCSAG